jgi:hypothetical protein
MSGVLSDSAALISLSRVVTGPSCWANLGRADSQCPPPSVYVYAQPRRSSLSWQLTLPYPEVSI